MANGFDDYKTEVEYCEKHANDGSLTSDNPFYQKLKGIGNMPDLQRWLAREITPKVKQV